MLQLVSLDFIMVFTRDVTASKNWYRDVLDIEPIIDEENFAEFKISDTAKLCLHSSDAKSPISTGGSVGYWRVKELDAVIEHLKSYGARIYRGPLDIENNERICQIIDPMGNVIGFVG